MARPQKSGLEYFPLDVDIDNDEKVAYVISRYGFQAFGLLIKILMNIYHDGYYMMWTERQQYLFSFKLNVDSEYAKTVVSAYINEGFFDKNIYEKYGVLTSHGIQIRYLQAVGRRAQVRVAREYCLFSPEESSKMGNISIYSINVSNNQVNVSNNQTETTLNATESTQSKVKESKLNNVVVVKGDKENDGEEINGDFSEVINLFSNNIHPLSGEIEMNQLSDFLDHYGKEWTLAAITEAAERHGMSVKYISSILMNWERNGFKTEKQKGGRQYGRNRGNDSRNRSKKERDDKYADFEEADRRQVHPWDLPADGDGAGAEPGKDT